MHSGQSRVGNFSIVEPDQPAPVPAPPHLSADSAHAPATARASAVASLPSVTHGWVLAVVATLVMSVSYIDRQALAAVAKTVRTDLGMSHSQYGMLGAAFGAAYLIGAPLAGILLDKFGARRGLVFAVLAWSLVAALHAGARSFATLLLLRVLLGLAEAPSFPGAAQAVRRSLRPAHRSLGIGLLFTGSSIGAMIAAPLAIYLTTKYDWRAAFAVISLVGLFWIPGWLLVTRGVATVAPGYTANEEASATPEPSTGLLAPSTPLLARRVVWRAVVAILASAPGIMVVLQWFPQYLAEGRHALPADMARTLWIPPLAFDAGAVIFGGLGSVLRRKDSRPPRALLGIAALLASSLALVPFAPGLRSVIAVASVSMAGGAGVYVLATSELFARILPSETSRAGGISAAAQSLTHIVCNLLVGVVVDGTHSFDLVMYVGGALLVPGALLWTFFPEVSASDAHRRVGAARRGRTRNTRRRPSA